jgi:hypothetical protein
MEPSEAVRAYLALEAEWLEWQKAHPEDTPEEDALLDRMDVLWWAMTREERDALRRP